MKTWWMVLYLWSWMVVGRVLLPALVFFTLVTAAHAVQSCRQPDGSVLTVPDRIPCTAMRDGVGLTPLQEAEKRIQAARDGLDQIKRECIQGHMLNAAGVRAVELCTK